MVLVVDGVASGSPAARTARRKFSIRGRTMDSRRAKERGMTAAANLRNQMGFQKMVVIQSGEGAKRSSPTRRYSSGGALPVVMLDHAYVSLGYGK